MRNMIIVVALIFLTASNSGLAYTDMSARDAYEMQQKCAKDAKAYFVENEGSSGISEDTKGTYNKWYENHYNKDLNRCFILVEYKKIGGKGGSTAKWAVYNLIDVNENRTYASLMTGDSDEAITCIFNDSRCVTSTEWWTKVRAYMGK